MVQDLAQDLAQDLVQGQDLAQDLAQDQVQDYVQDQVQYQFQDLVQVLFFRKIMKFDLKWVHMARYELILIRLDGALWLKIIFIPLLTPKTTMEGPNI